MPCTCVVGLQWGDEAKGKIVDLLCDRHDAVVRYQGGANAGHTVVVVRGSERLMKVTEEPDRQHQSKALGYQGSIARTVGAVQDVVRKMELSPGPEDVRTLSMQRSLATTREITGATLSINLRLP